MYRNSVVYDDMRFLESGNMKISYFFIRNDLSTKYLIWLNNYTETINQVYADMVHLAGGLQINVIFFDYLGRGKSEGEFNNDTSYKSFKNIVKNISQITGKISISHNDIIFCGKAYGCDTLKKYIKHHKYSKCIMIEPPRNYLSKKISTNKKIRLIFLKNNEQYCNYSNDKIGSKEYAVLLENYQALVPYLQELVQPQNL